MSMDTRLWSEWSAFPELQPIVVPRGRSGRFEPLALEDALDTRADLVRGAVRLVRSGRAQLVPEPLRSEVVRWLQARARRPGELGAIGGGGLMAGGAMVGGGSSLFDQASGAASLLKSAAKVEEIAPAQAEKIAEWAKEYPPAPQEAPGATIYAPEGDKVAGPVATTEVVPTAGVYRTPSGEPEGWQKEVEARVQTSKAATRDPAQEQQAQALYAQVRQAVEQGVLTPAQAELVKKEAAAAMREGVGAEEAFLRGATKAHLEQGLLQATGGGAAPSMGGSLLGVGLGGPVPGTGPLGGPIGAALQSLFGAPSLPAGVRLGPGGVIATPWLGDPRWQRAAGMVDALGMGVSSQVLGLGPELAEIRRAIEQTWLDRDARERAEERARMREWRREVLRLLWAIYDQHLEAGYGATYGARRY